MNPLRIYNLTATAIIVILCIYCYYLNQKSIKLQQIQTGMYLELMKTQKDLKETEHLLQQCDEKYIEAIGLKHLK